MTTTNEHTERTELKPCPFCGHTGLDFSEGSTFRWIVASCSECGASRGETRIQTLGEGTKEEWMAEAQDDAIREWNQRAAMLEAQQPTLKPLTDKQIAAVAVDADCVWLQKEYTCSFRAIVRATEAAHGIKDTP